MVFREVGQRIWTSSPLTQARRGALRAGTSALSSTYSVYKVHPATWRFTATHYQPWMGDFARWHAWMTCQLASLNVPAYRAHLAEHDWRFRWWDLDNYPPTDKESYVKRHTEAQRSRRGVLELRGTIVDESSGSSGTPYNWVRGRDELADVHRNVAGFASLMMRGEDRLFVINAYSMGAWATGTNTGIAMAKIAMVKNTGPDLDKIVDTLRHFGPEFTYLVAAYPPFLKDLRDRLDAEGWDWPAWRMHGLVGGEGMTEALRDYCEERFLTVRSGYGASDLTIGIGGETDLTVWLRRALLADHDLREAVLGPGEARTPMIFQYNPLETYLETTPEGELLCTLTSTSVLSPKLRYNIGDEARLMDWHDLAAVLRANPEWQLPAREAFHKQGMKLPLLLLFGRADSTISFMGANIYPQDVENGLYTDERRAAQIASFTLTLEDRDGDATSQTPTIHVELRPEVALADAERDQLAADVRTGVVAYLARTSRDFAQSLEESDRSDDIDVRVHAEGTGPFAGQPDKLKRVYLSRDGRSS
ncbi:MAG: phenylacetate--CoA ligase family protein [Ornithinimicrobium sp.]|uniref:phenylacetate--CoA ligase family protein n=1 Tax=Ornithinimicrobium sp. TaxID=1977084 RepID=UPI0026DF2E8C|nr:phenylacetate--CoA ligase family protein [Ornithinimicrobium sp.]MDO5738997.1 phenylacetate--CoA ligase family protein [Ornithinimicrobium sp.]